MKIKGYPLIVAFILGIPLHLAFFAFATYQYARTPGGSDQASVNARLIAILVGGIIILFGSFLSSFAVGMLYTTVHTRKYQFSKRVGIWGTLISSEVARLLSTIVIGCIPLALSLQFIDHVPADKRVLYHWLTAPFLPWLLEIGLTFITAPLAILAGTICTNIILRSQQDN